MPTDIRSTAENFLDVLFGMDRDGHRDIDAILALCDQSFTSENPFATSDTAPKPLNKADYGALQRRWQGHFRDLLTIRRRIFADEIEGVATVEAEMSRTVPSTGEYYRNRYVFVIEIRDGLVVALREYANPLAKAVPAGSGG